MLKIVFAAILSLSMCGVPAVAGVTNTTGVTGVTGQLSCSPSYGNVACGFVSPTVNFGPPDSATPAPQMFTFQSVATGTANTPGADMFFRSSLGTGNYGGGTFRFMVSRPGGSGSGQNPAVQSVEIGFNRVIFSVSAFGSDANAFYLNNMPASTTVPTLIPRRTDLTTGIGSDSIGGMSIIANGAEKVRVRTEGLTMISGQMVLAQYTVATLPTGIRGGMAYVTDASACTYLSVVSGGGSTFCPVIYNGSQWVGH